MGKRHQDIYGRKILDQRARLYGDDITAVIVEDEVAAAKAARLIKMEYEEYTPVVTMGTAMAKGTTPLHPDLRKDSVITRSHMTIGDNDFIYEDGLRKAGSYCGSQEIISPKKEYDTPKISHCRIELPVSWAYVDTNGKITMVFSTQIPHIVRRYTAQALGVPIGRVYTIKPYIGGGLGSKQDVLYEPLNALLTMSVGGRPVRLEISRKRTIFGTCTRHVIKGKCKGLVTKNGHTLAKELGAYANNGIYVSHGRTICAGCSNVFENLYRNKLGTEVDYFTVYASSPTVGVMRAYGIPQAAWFAECLTDNLAGAIDTDPCEFRLKNCMEDGFVGPANGITFHSYGLRKCTKEERRRIRRDEKWGSHRN